MNPLRALSRDLFERRLWPLVALLALAVIAIPVLFLHSPESDATDVTPGAALSPAAAGQVKVPASVQSLLSPTSGYRRVTGGKFKDPFLGPAAATPGAETAATTVANPVGGSAPSGPSATQAQAAGPGSTGSVTVSGGTNVAPAPAAKPAAPGASAASASPRTVYRTDVRYGADNAPVMHDLARLTALPSAQRPVAIFLGVLNGGRGAIFEVRTDARPVGSSACRPTPQVCTWVVVTPGGHVDLQVPVGSNLVHQRLSVAAISAAPAASAAAALRAHERSDPAGRCLLGPLAAYHYDPSTGTLQPRSEVSGCQYTVTSPSAASNG